MNASEGLRRIAKLVRWIASGFAVMIFAGGVVLAFSMEPSARLLVLAVSAAIGAAVHFGGRGMGWVIDGFAEPKENK
jgi:hypothetical protein